MSAVELSFMGACEPETFRCRIYGTDAEDERVSFLRRLGGEGVLDAPIYDARLAEMEARGLVSATFEPAAGGGRWKRWRLTQAGRAVLARIAG